MYSTYDVYTLYIYIHLYTYLFFHINIINHIYDTWGLRSQGETNFCKWISGSDRFAARWTAVQQPDLEKKYYQFGARLKHLETSPTRAGVWKNMKVVNLLWIYCESIVNLQKPDLYLRSMIQQEAGNLLSLGGLTLQKIWQSMGTSYIQNIQRSFNRKIVQGVSQRATEMFSNFWSLHLCTGHSKLIGKAFGIKSL